MSNLNVVTMIQARSGSSRLPGKILKDIQGKPVLIRMLERVARASRIGQLVVVTTDQPSDDPIEALCEAEGYAVFRGDENDLLDRHFQAARAFDADVAVKIPSDCPLIDPAIIDQVIGVFLLAEGDFDFVSNLHPPTHPDGNDVEVMSRKALEKAWKEAKKDYEREHTTPYFWENPDLFPQKNIVWDTGKDYSLSHRFVLDYAEDFEFISAVFERLLPKNSNFGLPEILDLLDREPALLEINKKYCGVAWYKDHLDDLKTIDPTKVRSV